MTGLVSAPFLLLFLLPQEPPEVLARYLLEGKAAVVTRTDVALEMAFDLRRHDRGPQACELLVDTTLTRAAATRQNLMPTTAEVEEFWRKLQQQLRSAGHRPEDFAAVRNTSMEQWFADLAVQMAQERLVRAELGVDASETVSPDMLKLWLQEERKKRKVVTDPDQLPVGTAVRVDDTDVPILDLGFLLLRTSEDEERDRFVRQVAYLQSIEALGRSKGIEVTTADLDAAVKKRREDAARDPRYRGIGYDQMLQAQGFTVASLRERRVFRAHVLLDKLTQLLHPTDELLADVQRDRKAALDLVGPRRHLGIVFVRALDEPNGLVPLDFPAATKRLEAARQRLAEESFENVARIESQDPATKLRSGDSGWHRRRSTELPEAVLEAAFVLSAGEVSPPVRTEEGCYLVKVLDVEPDPTNAQLVELLRAYRGQELQKRILREAAIEMRTGSPEAGK